VKSEPIIQAPVRPKGEKRRAQWPTLLLVLGVLALLVVVPFMILRPRADTYLLRSYETAPVRSGTLTEYVRGAGTLVPRLERSLLAPGEGVMAEWRVAEGDAVRRGEGLGRLSSPELRDAVAAREGALEEARRALAELRLEQEVAVREEESARLELQRALDEAQRTLATTRSLFEIGAASQAELASAESAAAAASQALATAQANAETAQAQRDLALEGARAAVSRAERDLRAARDRAASLELRAPIEGRVLRLEVEVGETVAEGAVLATLASSAELRVEADLPETQARGVSVGQRAKLTVADQTYPGTVVQVSQQAEASSEGGAVVPVVLEFERPPRGLRVGASASVEIEVGRTEDALYLPRGPYLTTGGERLAYVVSGDTAVRRTVIFGLIDGERVEVREGLTEGQRVVTSSYEAFKDREEVALAPEGEISWNQR